jgi:hypothetical protein
MKYFKNNDENLQLPKLIRELICKGKWNANKQQELSLLLPPFYPISMNKEYSDSLEHSFSDKKVHKKDQDQIYEIGKLGTSVLALDYRTSNRNPNVICADVTEFIDLPPAISEWRIEWFQCFKSVDHLVTVIERNH